MCMGNQEIYHHWGELPQVSFLSPQKFCCDKHTFVMTKMILVAAPTNDRNVQFGGSNYLTSYVFSCFFFSFFLFSVDVFVDQLSVLRL